MKQGYLYTDECRRIIVYMADYFLSIGTRKIIKSYSCRKGIFILAIHIQLTLYLSYTCLVCGGSKMKLQRNILVINPTIHVLTFTFGAIYPTKGERYKIINESSEPDIGRPSVAVSEEDYIHPNVVVVPFLGVCILGTSSVGYRYGIMYVAFYSIYPIGVRGSVV